MSGSLSPAAQLERTMLGACMLEEELPVELACALLRVEHFELDSHQRIFRAIQRMHAAEQTINFMTLSCDLGKELGAVGGQAYLASLTEGLPYRLTEPSLRNYIERIQESWGKREIGRLGNVLAGQAQDPDSTVSGLARDVTTRMEAIVSNSDEETADITSTIVGFRDRFCERRLRKQSPGLSYGMPELDKQTGGMMPGEQTAVGAVSGVGKTAFMAQGIWATLQAGYAVDAFLLEPTKDQITSRLISLMTRVPYGAIIKPWLATDAQDRLVLEGAGRLAEMPLRMFGRSNLTLDEVLGQARIGMRKRRTRLICTDYIQRLKIRASEKDEPVRLRVGRASTALADLVKDTDTHSMLLSQINTGRKNGVAGVPTMFDFRESSQIENDAHTIILLHREFDEKQGHYTNSGAIFVPKQRNGTPCNLRVWFDPVTAAWTDQKPRAS